MKTVLACALALVTAAAFSPEALAKGCLEGAAVGATAGHFAGHHGVLGAAAGCVVGRHEANKRDRQAARASTQNGSRPD